jgi:hypothetical protein
MGRFCCVKLIVPCLILTILSGLHTHTLARKQARRQSVSQSRLHTHTHNLHVDDCLEIEGMRELKC